MAGIKGATQTKKITIQQITSKEQYRVLGFLPVTKEKTGSGQQAGKKAKSVTASTAHPFSSGHHLLSPLANLSG
jgi:hypothetical protein